jgi:hypothetical protein
LTPYRIFRSWRRKGGGKSAAVAYTLIEAAKLNGIDLQAWLRQVRGWIADHKKPPDRRAPPVALRCRASAIPTLGERDSRGGTPCEALVCFTMANRRMFAMAAPLPLRSDFDADTLRREARRSRNVT